MKKTKNKGKILKIILVVLIVILISMISFVGIYAKRNGNYKNLITNYKLGMELEGTRTLILKPDSSSETIVKDSEGNIIENATEDEIKEKGYTQEEVPVNSEENLTEENFINSKEIIENRLKEYKFEEYSIKQDLDSGNIILELAENDNTDTVLSVINKQGKFEIKDSTTDEVLIDNSMIKQAKVLYNTTTTGTSVYLNIEFTKEGKEKLTQITTDYKTIEEANSENAEETAESAEDAEGEESEEAEQTQKEIVMEIDGEAIITTSFDEPITTGQLQLTVGSNSKDSEKLKDYIKQAQSTASVLTTGSIPVKYTADTNKYIKTSISNKDVKIAFYVALIIIALISLLLIIKYKTKGVLASILAIGFIALVLLVIRYTNVKVSSAGIIAIIAVSILNYLLEILILNNSNKKDEEKEKILNIMSRFIFTIFPIFIIAVTFSFITSTLLNSFGMILFWGIILTLVYNLIFTKPLLNK